MTKDSQDNQSSSVEGKKDEKQKEQEDMVNKFNTVFFSAKTPEMNFFFYAQLRSIPLLRHI